MHKLPYISTGFTTTSLTPFHFTKFNAYRLYISHALCCTIIIL